MIAAATDELACNYNPEANVSDGSCYSCDIPAAHCGEGTFWDDESQSCVITNPSDTNFDGCVSMTDLLDLLTVFGTCTEEEPEDDPEVAEWSCGDPLEYQGYDYETVQIGEQCWFAENLRAEAYRDGTSILSDLTGSDWQYLTTGASAIYGESDGCEDADFFLACDPNESLIAFGRLYNWFAVGSDHGLCPSSWHVPSESEWDVLDEVLGGGNLTDEALKSTFGWNSDNGTNTSGFGALPSGKRDVPGGDFKDAGSVGGWWSSTDAGGPYAWTRLLNTTASQLVAYDPNKKDGYSVRCIKDAE